MSDREILDEVNDAYKGDNFDGDIAIAKQTLSPLFTRGYLAAKRKYHHPSNGLEVKTRKTVDEFLKDPSLPMLQTIEEGLIRIAWNAAVASVILPEGRFEVPPLEQWPDDALAIHISFVSGNAQYTGMKIIERFPRPLPTTVELTTEEKIDAIAAKRNNPVVVFHDIALGLANGKTLDQLCAEYNVPTTKELS